MPAQNKPRGGGKGKGKLTPVADPAPRQLTKNERKLEKEGVPVAPPARPVANTLPSEPSGSAPSLRRSTRQGKPTNLTLDVFPSEAMQTTRKRVPDTDDAEDEEDEEEEDDNANEEVQNNDDPNDEGGIGGERETEETEEAENNSEREEDVEMSAAPAPTENLMKRPRSPSDSSDSDEENMEDDEIPMEGASREHGGFARGRSRGNAYKGDGPLNPDFEPTDLTLLDTDLPTEGKVYFRPERTSDSDVMNLPVRLTNDLSEVVEALGSKYPIVKTNNVQLWLLDEEDDVKSWTILGQYADICAGKHGYQTVEWQRTKSGKYTITLGSSAHDMKPRDIRPIVQPRSTSLSRSLYSRSPSVSIPGSPLSMVATLPGSRAESPAQSVMESGDDDDVEIVDDSSIQIAPEKRQLANALGIPLSYVNQGGGKGGGRRKVREAWVRYKAFDAARRTYREAVADKTWRIPQTTENKIRALFCVDTTWQANWQYFERVKQDSDLWHWLEQTEDCPTTEEVFGAPKATFEEMKNILTASTVKGKEKERDKKKKRNM